jgi:formylglycine-generating enzyme required for sulfatase activity
LLAAALVFPERTDQDGLYGNQTKTKVGYRGLQGYRLPTEAEWEYACRAGTVTAWSHGSDETMLEHYAWYDYNSGSKMHPPGWLKPNALGLFDMHGNAWQWCQDFYYEARSNKGIEDIKDKNSLVLRGGSGHDSAMVVRSAFRRRGEPANRNDIYGLRVARTCH